MNAGTALLTSFQSILVMLTIISAPVRISAGPVQYTGMLAAHTRSHANNQHSPRHDTSITVKKVLVDLQEARKSKKILTMFACLAVYSHIEVQTILARKRFQTGQSSMANVHRL